IPTAHGRKPILKTPKPLDSETHANCMLLRILVQSHIKLVSNATILPQAGSSLEPARCPRRHGIRGRTSLFFRHSGTPLRCDRTCLGKSPVGWTTQPH